MAATTGMIRTSRLTALMVGWFLIPGLLSGQAIEGHLLASGSDDPIVLATVTLLSGAGEVVDQTFTDEKGFFLVASEEAGSYFLRAEHLGFRPRVDGIFDLGEGGRLTVEFRLVETAIPLDTLTVAVERKDLKLDLLGFYDRMGMGFGRFLGPEEIEKRPALRTTDLLRNIPRVRINERPFGRTTVTIAGSVSARGRGCYPAILIDGFVVARGGDEAARPDEWVSPADIRGIEVYRGAAETPLQYGGASSPCGVILIWTG